MTRTVADELESMIQMFGEKFPDQSESAIARLVNDVYNRLSAEATVTAHLIPLTMNRCQRTLERQRYSTTDGLTTANPMTIAS